MGGPSAIDDILNNPRFQGAIDSISGVTAFADSLFVAFISFVAFFIISAALLRNVIAGAYAAYPKLFDWVAEAKEAGIQRMQGVSRVGPIAGFFLRLIPDFKNLSDFHDDTVEPKHYFMKAIPQMIGVVMIGVVIYNGYYRDAVSITAGFGSQLISRVLLTVDPVAVFDKLANTSGNPTFANDSAQDTKGKLINSLSEDIYGKIISFHTDVNGEAAKSDLGRQIEQYVTSQVNSLDPALLAEGSYSIQKQVTRVFGQPDVSSLAATDTELMKTVGWAAKIQGQFTFSTTKHVGEDWWLRIILRFNKEAEKAPVEGASTSLTLIVPPANISQNADGSITITLSSTDQGKLTVGSSSASGVKVNGQTATVATDGKSIKINSTQKGTAKKSLTDVTGIFYSYPGVSQPSQIRTISLNEGTVPKFTDPSGKLNDFEFGQQPTKKQQ